MAFTRLLRTALIVLTIGLAVGAGMSAFVQISRVNAPERVLALFPSDGLAGTVAAERDMVGAADPMMAARLAQGVARRALVDAPLDPRALRLLGVGALASNREADGLRFLQLSQRVSRRDLGTRLALIQYYSASGNVPATLEQYDLALSTGRGGDGLLLPVLAKAIEDPTIRAAAARYVRADRPWLYPFLVYAIPASERPDALAAWIDQAGGLPGDPTYRVFESQLLSRLAVKNEYEALRTFFLRLPGTSEAMLTTMALTPTTTNSAYRPVTWYLSDEPDIGAALADGGSVSVRVSPDGRGTALQRILYLVPGRHSFTARTVLAAGEGNATWELRCLNNGPAALLWQRDIRPSSAPVFRDDWLVPERCPAQLLTLNVAGTDSQVESNLTVSELAISSSPSRPKSDNGTN